MALIDLNDINSKMTNKNITVFEEIRKDLDVAKNFDQFKVPMSYVFGKGALAAKESFGGLSFAENSLRVDAALKNASDLQNIWNRSHSQWTWKHINLSYHAAEKNMRQISAEIANKKNALNEAKWKHIKNEVKIKKIEEELLAGNLDYWKEVDLKIRLAESQEKLAESSIYIEGAMKDILSLNELYEQLKSKMSQFSEDDIEKQESKAHLKRSLVQCLRDVRQFGSITKGEQEYLEQIGVNPSKIQRLLREYVKSEESEDAWDVSGLHSFIEGLTNELIDKHQVDKVKMELQGFDHDPISSISYDKKIALLDKPEE